MEIVGKHTKSKGHPSMESHTAVHATPFPPRSMVCIGSTQNMISLEFVFWEGEKGGGRRGRVQREIPEQILQVGGPPEALRSLGLF